MRIGSVRLRLFWAWFDLWVGARWSNEKRALYICLIPTVVLAVEFGRSPVLWEAMEKAVVEHVLSGAPTSLGIRGRATKNESGVITDFELDSVSVVAVQEQEHAGSSDREEA